MSAEARGDGWGMLEPPHSDAQTYRPGLPGGAQPSKLDSHPNSQPIRAPCAVPPDLPELQPGAEVIAGYVLYRKLGKGGFGEVWEARGPGGFAVAIKVIPFAGDAAETERRSLDLIREIRHANLLTTFGAWEFARHLVLAMELAERTLDDRFKEAIASGLCGIPREELLEFLHQAAMGLDYLNEPQQLADGTTRAGVQHRDVKPGNILLVGNSVKVADFGLARLLERSVTGHTGSMTPAYAAPEFFKGQTSNRSDQYSLAVTYCFLLTGHQLFSGSIQQMMHGHLMRDPDLSRFSKSDRVVLRRALAKNPSERWGSCREFVRALERAEGASSGGARRATAAEQVSPEQQAADRVAAQQPLQRYRTPARDRSKRRHWPMSLTVSVAALVGLVTVIGILILGKPSSETVPEPDKMSPMAQDPSLRGVAPVSVRRKTPRGPTGPNRPPTVSIESIGPGEPQIRYAIHVEVAGNDPDGDPLTFEYRKSSSGQWIPSPDGKIVLLNLVAATIPIEVRAVDTHGETSVPLAETINNEWYKTVTNAIGMVLVRIEPGEFWMGSRASPQELGAKFGTWLSNEWEYEYPRHGVTITRPFLMGKYEVTVGQFRQFVADAKYVTELERDRKGGWGYNEAEGTLEVYKPEYTWQHTGWSPYDDSHPVVNVTWNDARKFCDWLSKKEEKTGAERYSLPTEAEWEYACRGGTETMYWNGDDPQKLTQIDNILDGTAQEKLKSHLDSIMNAPVQEKLKSLTGGTKSRDRFTFTAKVGMFPANPFGLCDMHGNVWEWCADIYDAKAYGTRSGITADPYVRSGSGTCALRGGSWFTPSWTTRTAFRGSGTPDLRSCLIGFRVVCGGEAARTPPATTAQSASVQPFVRQPDGGIFARPVAAPPF